MNFRSVSTGASRPAETRQNREIYCRAEDVMQTNFEVLDSEISSGLKQITNKDFK